MWTDREVVWACGALVALVLLACGGATPARSATSPAVPSGTASSAPTATPVPTSTRVPETPTPTMTLTATPPPTSVPSPTVVVPVATSTPPTPVPTPEPPPPLSLDIESFEFPKNVAVALGAAVTWTNRDSSGHDVSADDGSFGSARLVTGDSYTYRFERLGTLAYHCSIHPYMVGTIVVR